LTTFADMGLSPRILDRLSSKGFTDPTPIQSQAIPHILNGRDIMGLAQTGTGKTAAFGLPILHHLWHVGTKPEDRSARALILAPTRELASQITENLLIFSRDTHLKVALVVGGVSINTQIKRLQKGTDVLVATPGRLLDLLNRRAITLSDARYLVLDEADQMLDMGFIHDLRKISTHLPEERQTMMFSATMPKLMGELAETYLNSPLRVQVSPPGKAADKVTQEVHFMQQGDKGQHLKKLLGNHREERALVFSRTKHGAEKLKKGLVAVGFAAASIHGNKSQGQRTRALEEFKSGEVKILVATDVAARGIDIPQVMYVYNYDLPNVPENYVHRIGRTARAGAEGTAIAFCSPDEMGELRAIEKVLKSTIKISHGKPWDGDIEGRGPGFKPKRGRGGPSGNSSGRRRFGAKPEGAGGGGGNRSGKPGGGGQRRRKKSTRNSAGAGA